MALVAFVVRDYFASAGFESQSPVERLPVLPADIAAQSRSWRWTQSTGEDTQIEVSAADFTQDSAGLETDLRGVELKVFHADSATYDRVESAAMRMLAGGELYSEGETVITLGLTADGSREPPVVVTTSGVTFQPRTNSARTGRDVNYRLADARGRSRGAVYDAASATLQMLADVRLEGSGDEGVAPAYTVRAGSLRYSEQGAVVELGGGARLEQGGQWVECDSGIVQLAGGRVRRVQCAEALGGRGAAGDRAVFGASAAEAEFGEEGELLRVSGTGGARLKSFGADHRLEVESSRMGLRYEAGDVPGSSFLREVEARGRARAGVIQAAGDARSSIESEALALRFGERSSAIERVETLAPGRLRQGTLSGGGPSSVLDAGRIRLAYGPDSKLERLEASGDARLVQGAATLGSPDLKTWSAELAASFDPATSALGRLRQTGAFRFEDGARQGAAASASFDPGGGVLELEGDASISDGGSTMLARRVLLNRESGRLEAEGGVTGSMQESGAEGAESVPLGLFGRGSAVFLAADALLSDPQRKRLEYRGGARLWQGRNRIAADAILVELGSRKIEARGNVAAAWGGAGAAAANGLAAVRSEEMVYEEEAGQARFSGSVDFRRSGIRVLSDTLSTALGADREGGERPAVAEGSVRIAELGPGPGHRASGDRAELGFAGSEVTLTGSPAWIDSPDGTRSEGGRLTYRLAGDSLLLLGRGKDRALTYSPAAR